MIDGWLVWLFVVFVLFVFMCVSWNNRIVLFGSVAVVCPACAGASIVIQRHTSSTVVVVVVVWNEKLSIHSLPPPNKLEEPDHGSHCTG